MWRRVAPLSRGRRQSSPLPIEWCQRKTAAVVKTPLAFSFCRNEMVRRGVLLFVARLAMCVFPRGLGFIIRIFLVSPKAGRTDITPMHHYTADQTLGEEKRREADAEEEEEIAIRICPLYPSVFTLDECVGCTKGFEAILRNRERGRVSGGRVSE